MSKLQILLACTSALLLAAPPVAPAQQTSAGPSRVLNRVKVGGEGGYDYVNADADARRLYIARGGSRPRITVFDLDTLSQVGEITGVGAHGAVVDPVTTHGFASSKPVLMFDSRTLQTLKTIEVGGNPDGMFFDAANQRVYVLSHAAPTATVIDSKDGAVLSTIDLGGQPEQMVSDGAGRLYVNLIDNASIAVVDAKTLAVITHFSLAGQGGQCTGLAIDPQNRVLFAACRNPQNMVMLNADNGKILGAQPIGLATDNAAFVGETGEAFSSNADGTLTVIKEAAPDRFLIGQTVETMRNAKTMALDSKTNRLILIGADYQNYPGPGVVRGAPPNPMIPDSFTIVVVGK